MCLQHLLNSTDDCMHKQSYSLLYASISFVLNANFYVIRFIKLVLCLYNVCFRFVLVKHRLVLIL